MKELLDIIEQYDKEKNNRFLFEVKTDQETLMTGVGEGDGRYVILDEQKDPFGSRGVTFINDIEDDYEGDINDFVIMEFERGKFIMKIALSDQAIMDIALLADEMRINRD